VTEIITRSDSLVLADQVDFRQRLIDLVAVPYEQETEVLVRGEMWHEVFERKAFNGIQDRAGRIPANREHTVGETFGKVVKADPNYPDGLFVRVRVAKTPLGDETLQLASEDMLGASVGYYVKKPSDLALNRRTMQRRVKRAFLQHLSLVESPAYENAAVLAVRNSDEKPPGAPVQTPGLDEFVNDDLFAWANSRLG
jgi:HK97 family phage prohead protease